MSIETAILTEPPCSVDAEAFAQPPSLHWAVVLMLWVLTGGLFGLIWIFRQAAWARRIDPTCNALVILAVAFPLHPTLAVLAVVFDDSGVMSFVASLLFPVAFAWSYLKMRDAIESRFDLELSAPLTLFFHALYLQYHMRLIAKRTYSPRRRRLLV